MKRLISARWLLVGLALLLALSLSTSLIVADNGGGYWAGGTGAAPTLYLPLIRAP